MRVTEGSRQGIIFFQNGEIIHALCDELDGEVAFYEIISFAHGHLDTVNIADLPERTIFKPYVAMLMEGSRRRDEQGGHGADHNGEPLAKDGGAGAEVENITPPFRPAAAVQPKPESRPLAMAELLEGFKGINGYKAAAIMKASGEILAQDAINSKIDLRLVGETLNGFFRNARAAAGKIGLDSCHEAVLGTRSDVMVMGCSGEGRGGEDANLVLALFSASGNQALGRREMRKVIARLAAVTA